MSDPDMGQFTIFTAEGSLVLLLYLLLKHLKYLTEKAIRVLSLNEELLNSNARRKHGNNPWQHVWRGWTHFSLHFKEPFQMQLCHSSLRRAEEEPLWAPWRRFRFQIYIKHHPSKSSGKKSDKIGIFFYVNPLGSNFSRQKCQITKQNSAEFCSKMPVEGISYTRSRENLRSFSCSGSFVLFYRMVTVIYHVSPATDQSSKHAIMAITLMQKEINALAIGCG